MPSAHTYTYRLPTSERRQKFSYSPCQTSFHRTIVVGERPEPSWPRQASASGKSLVEIPFRYSQGTSSSIALVFLKYGGRIFEVKCKRLPSWSRRLSFTRG